MKRIKRISKSGKTYYQCYTKKIWDRKSEVVISRNGTTYRRYKDEFRLHPIEYKGISPQRKRCLKRDNYACRICHHKSSVLYPHHRDLKGLGVTSNPDNSLNNLLSLCPSCHAKLHYRVFTKHRNIIRLRREGLTLQQIANNYSVSRQRIHQIVSKYNLQ